ncbi:tetratricopeptide repeat protein [Prolixibacter bellariivorans]|nr:tetratricopeptide repeat protein [Prolixibacter bellariivorans]
MDFFPLNTYARYQLARIYLSTKQLDKAEAILNEIISDQRSFGPAYRLIGNLYNAKGDSAWSKYYIIRANDLVPYAAPVDTIADKLAMLSRSEMYLLKQIDEAEKSANIEWTNNLVKHAMTYLPENQYLISKALKIHLKMDQGQKAIELVDKHLVAYQNQFTEIQEVANLFFDKRLYAPAARYYAQAVKLKPNDVKLQSRLAISQWQSGQKEEARDLTQQLLKNGQPDQLASGINLLLMFGEIQQAQRYLNTLKMIAPLSAQTQRMEGLMSEYLDRPAQAIKHYEAAFQKEPEDMTNVKNLIEMLFGQKMWKQALSRLGEAMKIHPNAPYVLERTGTLLVTCENQSLRNVNLGRELSERAFFHSTALPGTMLSAGRSLVLACAMQQDYTTAKKYMVVVLNLANNQNLPEEYMNDLLKINSSLQAHM